MTVKEGSGIFSRVLRNTTRHATPQLCQDRSRPHDDDDNDDVVVAGVVNGDASAVMSVGCVKVRGIVHLGCLIGMRRITITNTVTVMVAVMVGVRVCDSKAVAEASVHATAAATAMEASGEEMEWYSWLWSKGRFAGATAIRTASAETART